MEREHELEIIERVTGGDVNAFEELVREHERLVYSLAYRLLGNEQDAQDASQEAFIKAFRSIGSFRGESRLSVWLCRLTNNVCIDLLRRCRAPDLSLSAEDGDGEETWLELPDRRFDPQTELEKKELRRAVNEGLSRLPREYRSILTLRELGGLSYGEIAEVEGLDLGTVKSRIFRARKRLCAILTEDGNIFAEDPSKNPKGGEQA